MRDDILEYNEEDALPGGVWEASIDERAAFIAKTYLHLLGAILLFVGIELILFSSGVAEQMAAGMLGVNWLLILGGFMVVAWLASRVAHADLPVPVQYLALGGFVAAEAVIFVPLLWIANQQAPGAIESAAQVTLFGFTGLSAIVLITRKDFSFLRSVLMFGAFMALGIIVFGVLFNWALGMWFSIAMIALAGGFVLYDTSNVLHHYPANKYVGAALALFASVALLFWYVLRLFIATRR